MRRDVCDFRSRYRLAVERYPDRFPDRDRSDGQVQRHGDEAAATVGLVQNPRDGETATEATR